MRPCNQCGKPVSNAQLFCTECEPAEIPTPQMTVAERDSERESQKESIHAWLPEFIYRAFTAGTVAAIAIAIVGAPIGFMLEIASFSVLLAAVIGPVIGLIFAMLERWQGA